MRITSFAIFNQLTKSLQEGINKMSVLSDRLSTGKKINKPSDDVYGMMRSMSYKVTLNEMDQYRKNLDDAESQLALTDTIMSSVASAITRARELAVQASSGTQTAADRAAVAEEIASLRDEVLRLSKTKLGERYIFSGYKTDTEPFDASYNYTGDANEIDVLIDRNSTMAVNIIGTSAFSYGGETYFETLDDLYNGLVNNDQPVIQSSITALDNALGQTTNVQAEVGARLNNLDRLRTTLQERDASFKTLLSDTEDTDIAETISELTKIQVSLESLRASGAKVLSQSLLDFLR